MNKRPVFLVLALAAMFSLVFSACNASSETSVATSTSALLSATPEPGKEIIAVETTTPQPARQIPDGIVYAIPEMESVIATHTDIPYNTENKALKLDVYAPPGIAADARLPAVLFVHGSSPAQRNLKNHGQYVSWGKLMGASGLIAVTFNWDYPNPAIIEQLITFVRDHADKFQIDRDRLCVFAVSAGVSAGFAVALNDAPTYVRCVVGYYGDPSPALDVISSLETTKLPPILLAKAALDDPTLIEGTDRFVQDLTARGEQVTLLIHDNGMHAFDIRNDDDQSREIIEQTIEFIKLHLAK